MRDKKLILKNSLIIIVCVAASIILLMSFVQGYELQPNELLAANCTDCNVSYNNIISNYKNGSSFSVMCLQSCPGCNTTLNCIEPEPCPEINYTGTCNIKKNLMWGENLFNNEAPCDINITCEQDKYRRFQDVYYPVEMQVTKDQDHFNIFMEIFDFNEESYYNYTTTIRQEDIVEQKSAFEFICPHEIITDVNMQTCAEYLDPIIGETNPLIYQLAIGQNDCVQNILDCEAELRKESRIYLDWKEKYDGKYVEWRDCEEELDECNFNLNNPANGSCAIEKRWISKEFRDYKLASVEAWWMYLAVFFGLILALIIGNAMLGAKGL